MRRLALLCALALAACYSPDIPEGSFTCSVADPRCPAGLTCDPCSHLCVDHAHVCDGGVPDLGANDLSVGDLATEDLAPDDGGCPYGCGYGQTCAPGCPCDGARHTVACGAYCCGAGQSCTGGPGLGCSGPSPRYEAAFGYDEVHGETVLYGGTTNFCTATSTGDTWTWDGEAWTHLALTSAPLARAGAAATWDASRHQLIVAGGCSAGTTRNDTWLWDGTNWSNSGATLPSGLQGGPFASFGTGALAEGSAASSTATWTGAAWIGGTLTFNDSTLGRDSPEAMVYDEANKVLVLFGNYSTNVAGQIANRTWTMSLSQTSWKNTNAFTPATVLGGVSLVYDSDSHTILMFGGTGSGSQQCVTYAYDVLSPGWNILAPCGNGAPTGRSFAMLAYDRNRHRVVLFGGHDATGALGDLYELDPTGPTWVQR